VFEAIHIAPLTIIVQDLNASSDPYVELSFEPEPEWRRTLRLAALPGGVPLSADEMKKCATQRLKHRFRNTEATSRGKHILRSHVVTRSLHPVYNSTFTLPVDDVHGDLVSVAGGVCVCVCVFVVLVVLSCIHLFTCILSRPTWLVMTVWVKDKFSRDDLMGVVVLCWFCFISHTHILLAIKTLTFNILFTIKIIIR
jgi:hypothetical protein